MTLVPSNDTKARHEGEEAGHLFPHILLALTEMCQQECRALHATVVLVHAVTRTVPLRLTLLHVPIVTIVTDITGECLNLVMPRGNDLVGIKVQPMRSRLAFVLQDNALDLSISARLKVLVRCPPRPTVDLVGMRQITAVGTEERPRNDGADVED